MCYAMIILFIFITIWRTMKNKNTKDQMHHFYLRRGVSETKKTKEWHFVFAKKAL